MNTTIKSYLKSNSRNKIIISSEVLYDISYLNVGKVFSTKLSPILEQSRLSMRAKLLLDRLLKEAICYSEDYGNVLALTNIGFLLEDNLKIDFLSYLDKYSQDSCLILKWDGEIENKSLHFLTRESGIIFNIEKLSHIVI